MPEPALVRKGDSVGGAGNGKGWLSEPLLTWVDADLGD